MKTWIVILITAMAGMLTMQCSRVPLIGKAQAGNAISQELPEPAVDAGGLFEFPKKEDGLIGWLNWLAGAALFLVYEILVRIKPTSKTYSLLGLLYNLLNWFKADKAKNGDSFKIGAG